MEEGGTRSRAREAVAPLRRPAVPRLDLERLVPSTRSLVAGMTLLVGGLAAFVIARQSSLFAIRTIEVQGAPPALERQVRAALAPLVGESLVALDRAAVEERLGRLREVHGARFDRAFPNTLKVLVRPDPPVAVVRSGSRAWFVSARGAILRTLARPFPRGWPRVWIPAAETRLARTGDLPRHVSLAVRAVGDARRARSTLMPAVRSVRATGGDLTFVLRSGLQLRLGSGRDVPLKLAVASRVLRVLTAAERARLRYVDLTVPSRPVAGTNPRL